MEEGKRFFQKIFGVQHVFFQCLHAMGVEHVHPRQGPILGFLLHGGEGSQADIVRKMKVSAATVAVSISRLEKLGFVTRERNQENQRANVLRLTEKGRAVAVQMEAIMKEMSEVALEGFTSEEQEAMERYCDRMCKNLQQHYKAKE